MQKTSHFTFRKMVSSPFSNPFALVLVLLTEILQQSLSNTFNHGSQCNRLVVLGRVVMRCVSDVWTDGSLPDLFEQLAQQQLLACLEQDLGRCDVSL